MALPLVTGAVLEGADLTAGLVLVDSDLAGLPTIERPVKGAVAEGVPLTEGAVLNGSVREGTPSTAPPVKGAVLEGAVVTGGSKVPEREAPPRGARDPDAGGPNWRASATPRSRAVVTAALSDADRSLRLRSVSYPFIALATYVAFACGLLVHEDA